MSAEDAADRYGCALWLLAQVLGTRSERAATEQLEHARRHAAEAGFAPAALGPVLADLHATRRTLAPVDPCGRLASSSSPAQRQEARERTADARSALLQQLRLGTLPAPPQAPPSANTITQGDDVHARRERVRTELAAMARLGAERR